MKSKHTLFSPIALQSHPKLTASLPYNIALKTLADSQDSSFDVVELSAFSQAIEHEVSLIESRGFLVGPVTIQVGDQAVDCNSGAIPIPGFVEEEGLRFSTHSALGVLLVETGTVFDALVKASFCKDVPFILVTGSGIPRASCRRLLHRLERELTLPVHLLTDNDTWGYFIYSVLKRGMIGPQMKCEYHALSDPHYVGIKAGEAASIGIADKVVRRAKPTWQPRLTELRKYDCFRDSPWPQEFDAFEKQAGGVDVKAVIAEVGITEFINGYLTPKLMAS